MKYLIMLLVLSSCNLISPLDNVDERLQEFVDVANYEANIRGVRLRQIKVVFADMNNCAGKFAPRITGDKILIGRAFYNSYIDTNPSRIQKTIFHEFGHSMGRGHSDGIMTSGMPSDWQTNREQYLNELFKAEPK